MLLASNATCCRTVHTGLLYRTVGAISLVAVLVHGMFCCPPITRTLFAFGSFHTMLLVVRAEMGFCSYSSFAFPEATITIGGCVLSVSPHTIILTTIVALNKHVSAPSFNKRFGWDCFFHTGIGLQIPISPVIFIIAHFPAIIFPLPFFLEKEERKIFS